MIDQINMKAEYFTEREWESFLKLIPDEIVRGSKDKRLYVSWKNLRVEFYPISNQLWIRNSIHKFYNAVVKAIPIGQENYDDFTLSALRETVLFICKTFNRRPEDFELFGRLEYGVNIDVSPYSPREDIFDSYISHGTTRINSFYGHPKRKGKVIGSSCYLYEYRVKFYDKSQQAEIQHKGIMRYEICNYRVGRLKRLLGKTKVTLNDMMLKDTHIEFTRDLLKTYDDIKKLPTEFEDVPLESMRDLLSYSQPIMIKCYRRQMTKFKFNQHRVNGKQLLEKYSKSPNSIHLWVREKIAEKIENLINSVPCNIRGRVNKETISSNN